MYKNVGAQVARDAGEKPLDLLWVGTDKGVDPSVRKIHWRRCVREFKTKKQGKVQRSLPASQLFCSEATTVVAEGSIVTHSQRWPEQTRTSFDADTLGHQSSAFHGDSRMPH